MTNRALQAVLAMLNPDAIVVVASFDEYFYPVTHIQEYASRQGENFSDDAVPHGTRVIRLTVCESDEA